MSDYPQWSHTTDATTYSEPFLKSTTLDDCYIVSSPWTGRHSHSSKRRATCPINFSWKHKSKHLLSSDRASTISKRNDSTLVYPRWGLSHSSKGNLWAGIALKKCLPSTTTDNSCILREGFMPHASTVLSQTTHALLPLYDGILASPRLWGSDLSPSDFKRAMAMPCPEDRVLRYLHRERWPPLVFPTPSPCPALSPRMLHPRITQPWLQVLLPTAGDTQLPLCHRGVPSHTTLKGSQRYSTLRCIGLGRKARKLQNPCNCFYPTHFNSVRSSILLTMFFRGDVNKYLFIIYTILYYIINL